MAVIDPATQAITATVALQNDPTPAVTRRGREGLYSADFSASGFVSCASCHIDGRTDQLVSRVLGDIFPGNGPALPADLIDGVTLRPQPTHWPAFKGPLFTQSLQGLVDSPHEGDVPFALTNAPSHLAGETGSRSSTSTRPTCP